MPDRVSRELAGTRFGRVEWVAETGSTNDDLLAAARRGAPDGAVLVADHQVTGRGRLDRRWEAPPGSALLASVLVRPEIGVAVAHWMMAAAALALAEACETVAGVATRIKWPNDLVVERDGKPVKLAGVLADSILDGDRLAAVVIGVGCNLTWYPPDLDATSLAAEAGRPVDRDELLVAYLRALDGWYSRLRAGGVGELRASYVERSATLGRRVRAEIGDGPVIGAAAGIGPTGHLVIATSEGDVEVAAGDVIHLRPEP